VSAANILAVIKLLRTMKSNLSNVRSLSLIALLAISAIFGRHSLFASEKEVASFGNDNAMKIWTSVNDGVMGGVSKGGFKRSEQGTMIFSGELSLANNGGFASVRMKETELALGGTDTLVVKARGDGRTYWVDLRFADQMGASSYRAFLPTTAGEWKETRLAYADFKLQAFGRELPFKPINPASIASVGFTLADKKEGPFALEVEYVKAIADSVASDSKAGKTIVDVAKSAGAFKTLLAAATTAELGGVLSGEGPLTVLAPTDDAFAKLPAGTVDSLLRPENREQLVAILKNHVFSGRITLAKALEAREAASLQGSKISFRFENGRVLVGNAVLLNADIPASNGIIHAIDQVLIPESKETGPLKSSQLIELAIERGVPIFNSGDVAGCAAIYEVTSEALRTMECVPEESRTALGKALAEARAEKSARQRAWILRAALDKTFAGLESGK
jgi:uncharacterized surface protein with fasciclin (FAS1) repeats